MAFSLWATEPHYCRSWLSCTWVTIDLDDDDLHHHHYGCFVALCFWPTAKLDLKKPSQHHQWRWWCWVECFLLHRASATRCHLSKLLRPTGPLPQGLFLLGLTNWQISDKYWHLSDRFWHFAQFFWGQMHFCPYFCLNLLRIFVSMFWLARVDVEFLLEWIQNSKQICTDSYDTWNEITL